MCGTAHIRGFQDSLLSNVSIPCPVWPGTLFLEIDVSRDGNWSKASDMTHFYIRVFDLLYVVVACGQNDNTHCIAVIWSHLKNTKYGHLLDLVSKLKST